MNPPLELMTVLKELYNISGFRVSVHDTEMNELAGYPAGNSRFCSFLQQYPKNHATCVETDNEAFEKVKAEEQIIIYRCKFGLYEAIAPLYDFDRLAGYLMMGQAMDAAEGSGEAIYQLCADQVDDRERLRQEISQIPTCSREKILSYLNIMRICAEYITLTNRLNVTDRNLSREVRTYLQENYGQKISIEQLARHFLCSKSTLMNNFKKAYGITVNQYLTQVRLDHAKKLLERRGVSIREIAELCGFSDQNYFSKVFYKAFDVTPSRYREDKLRRVFP